LIKPGVGNPWASYGPPQRFQWPAEAFSVGQNKQYRNFL